MAGLRKRRPGLVYPIREDWHYVGEAGEPAFENSWTNSSGEMALAFRIREAGIVDIHGVVQGGAAPTIFTLPVGYRPSADSAASAAYESSGSTAWVAVSADGSVRADIGVAKLNVAHQAFLNLPAAAP
jgi:hypothetical protein